MKNIIRLLVITGVSAIISAQNATIAPIPRVQFFDNNGVELSGGLVYSYAGGTSTPIATYTDSTATGQNPNPIVLDSSGRAPIWLLPGVAYKFVVQTSGGGSLYTTDNIVQSLPNSGPFTTNGSNINNTNTGNVGIGCTSPVAKLDVCGASTGSNYLVRIDDSSNSPGINFEGAGPTLLGSIAADASAVFRVRAANAASQLVVTQGGFLVEDQTTSTGTTTLTVQAGAGQGTNHLFSIKSNAGTELAYADSVGRIVAPLYNADGAVGNSSLFTFQNSDSTFLVDGVGDVTLSGALHGVGNVQFDGNLNVTGNITCGGSCGGGGGGSFPVPDTTNLVESNGDHTKLFKIDASTNIPTGTTVTMHSPAASFTPVSEENTESISGLKTFTASMVNASGYFNSGGTGTGLVFNSGNIIMNGNGNITTSSSGATPGVTGGNINAAGFVDTAIWYGMLPSASAPAVTPGGGYSAMTYKGGPSGLVIWLYDTVHSAWSSIDLGAVAGGLTSLNGQTGPPVTIAGTSSQIIATTASNTITLSLPQAIATTSSVTFGNVTTGAGGAFNSQAGAGTGAGDIAYTVSNSLGSPFIVDGNGDISANGQLNLSGNFAAGSSCPSGSAICISNTKLIDTSRNAFVNNLTITGTCVGCASGSVGSLTGTANQVLVNGTSGTPTMGAITLTLPQSIGTGSAVTFGSVVATVYNSTATGSTFGFQNFTGNFTVDGNANLGAQTIKANSYSVGSNVVLSLSAGNAIASVYALTVGAGGCTNCGSGGGVTEAIGSTNQVIVSANTGPVTFTLPQQIGMSSNVNFGTINTSGAIQSQSSGGSTAFDVANGLGNPFIVNGNGDISGNGSINMAGNTGLGAYRVGGTIVIDNSRNLTNIASITLGSGGSIIVSGGSTLISGSILSSATVAGTTAGFGALSATTSITANGHAGITGSTCSHWTFGICDTP